MVLLINVYVCHVPTAKVQYSQSAIMAMKDGLLIVLVSETSDGGKASVDGE